MTRALALLLCLMPGCAYGTQHAYSLAPAARPTSGASSYAYPPADGADSYGDTVTTAERTVTSTGGGAPSFWFESPEPQQSVAPAISLDDRRALRQSQERAESDADFAQARQLYAQAQTSTTPTEPTATDAVDTSGELLIYTALFHVGVYDVAAAEAAIAESARSLGGFVFSQSDDTIVVRVPAARFLSFTTQIDGTYDVLHRQIDAQDVGEEFRDVEIRIRNLEVMRDRVAALLSSATDVEQALAVEQQLERITAELESLRGRQRFLADRISFSTVTVMFRPQPHDAIDQPEVFQLPFAWLESLGLPNLLELR